MPPDRLPAVLWRVLSLGLGLLLFTSQQGFAAPDFIKDVQPLLARSCVSCHGAAKQRSGYRLDSREIAIKGGEFGEAAIVPGSAVRSPLVAYIKGTDAGSLMPPADSGVARLTPDEIKTIEEWIDAGAEWPESASVQVVDKRDWWSFKPLASLSQGSTRSTSREIAEMIDGQIRQELKKQGLHPSPAADPRTLLKRLSIDLTGLSPTYEEVVEFERECANYEASSQSAGEATPYEKLVDRLLASPRYGERWARHWLDVVHFGETHGYDKDQPRDHAWPYRDYVIRSFNEDKPYAKFVAEQVAGDVLYPGERDGIEATGFLAAGPWDLIGHAEVPESKRDGKIARHLDRDDMVANTINTFCSLTVHCAQCHDHKFDPMSQEDYFSLQAVFSALDRTNRDYFPEADTNRKYEELIAARRRLANLISEQEKLLVARGGEAYAKLQQRIDQLNKGTVGNQNPSFGYHSAISSKPGTTKWVQVDLGDSRSIGKVVLTPCYDDFVGIGAGFGFPIRFQVAISDDPQFSGDASLFVMDGCATDQTDFPNPRWEKVVLQSQDEKPVVGRYLRITATKLALRQNDYIMALAEVEAFEEQEGSESAGNVAAGRPVTFLDSIEAPPRWRGTNLTDKIAPQPPAAGDLPALLRQREELLASHTTPEEARRLAESRRQLAQTQEELSLIGSPPSRIYTATIHHGSGNFIGTGSNGGKPRPVFLLARGSVEAPVREVVPGAIGSFDFAPARFALPEDAREGDRRAALARWLTNPNNPLVWRSIVNRVWQYHFGRGIVETPNDFGHMGALPTHPVLLDELAVRFRDDLAGSLKQLHRAIVLSETYRQRSDATDASAAQIDIDNRWLWRQNRRRLEAEALRDGILQVAGRLDLKMGGPSFRDFVIEHPAHSPHYEYHLADLDNPALHRRSIYRFLVRSQQQPWMASLDCADPSMLVDKRNQTITPLQALAQLNNQLVIVMSRHFAERVTSGTPPEQRVVRAFQLIFQRLPSAREHALIGDYARDHGWENTCRLLLNTNEFAFVD